MKVTLSFVPPGGGEIDYELDFDVPQLPQAGDCLVINRPGSVGASHFIVRRAWWNLLHPTSKADDPPIEGTESIGDVKRIAIECEFARGPLPDASHKESCDSYESKHGSIQKFDETMY